MHETLGEMGRESEKSVARYTRAHIHIRFRRTHTIFDKN